MQMNERLDIASLVESGAINRAPTRCGAGLVPTPQARTYCARRRVGARLIAPSGLLRPQARRGPIDRALWHER